MTNEVVQKGQLAKKASYVMNTKSTEKKNDALLLIAAQLEQDSAYLIEENKKDLSDGEAKGLDASVLDRILLNEARVQAMADAIRLLVKLPDPVGEVVEEMTKDNGMHITKKRVPLGVIGMIYEARPNVTIDAATLALKTGNAVILRGSSSAKHSNMALVASIHKALAQSDLPVDAVQLIEDTRRETAAHLFNLTEYLDVLIPRGGKGLIDLVVRESTVPVLETGAGNCHVYVEDSAELTMAKNITLNAKTQRPSVCNAMESLVVQRGFMAKHGAALLQNLADAGVTIIGDSEACAVFPDAIAATAEDFATEYLDLTVSVQTVADVYEAVDIINRNSTHHSEAIVTEDQQAAAVFLNNVDSAAVYHNVTTRFTDGFEFGYGAEIGISTQKLHARGPMGLPALTTTKYVITGNGQIRN